MQKVTRSSFNTLQKEHDFAQKHFLVPKSGNFLSSKARPNNSNANASRALSVSQLQSQANEHIAPNVNVQGVSTKNGQIA